VTSPELHVARTRPPDVGTVADRATSAQTRRARADRRLGWVIVLVFCGVFTLHVARGLNAPFGFLPSGGSVDAYNGAMWSTGARALRESGPIDSKFGAVWSDERDDRYADHPPAIYPATALSQWLAPEDELGARLLVLAASVAAAVLLFLLLCELGVVPVLAAASVGIGLSVPMFLTYGTMLDTLMLALPFAVAYVLFWQRSLNGRTNLLALGCTAAAVCLVAWEGVILVFATTVVMVVVRRDREHFRAIAAAGAGAVVAVLVTGLWQVWVYGGLSEVLDQGALRAGGGGFTSGEYVHSQLSWLRETFGIPAAVVLGIGVVALVANRRFRPVGLAALGTSFLYAVGFREGSFVHDYWNYWLVITLVLGVGAISSFLSRFDRRVWIPVGCIAAAVVVAFGFTAELREENLRSDGERYARSDAGFTRPARGQRWVPLINDSLGAAGSSANWVLPQARFYFRVPLRFMTSAGAVSYARRHPDGWMVLNSGVTGAGELVRGRDALARLAGATPNESKSGTRLG
jgi:4-amino-4-deoxy-L-arabinose transferase-like glycosyltransferase